MFFDFRFYNTQPGFIRLPNRRTKGKKSGRPIPLHPRVKNVLKELPSRFKMKECSCEKGNHLMISKNLLQLLKMLLELKILYSMIFAIVLLPISEKQKMITPPL
jgi:hypothetical protein